ncbi:uncharacterized protein AMSG_06106 [Thecamonas trahens ATCC 50062]|uniref:Uncharacterized protein n=1 Tax=Thecamonas trahens ATCC 50062 TaxID=461836 RepID=A0A0L0DBU9_THETB|nr:hypothetical protein AMSG_06106 [Thecamonas trahens ATCC 50062]KNC49824.1 hypothetical protein AMSG_06106 [Thecamonas trahens ATCC 50062]|eukprot:XP_013757319.1 hypothetical protein AMSG_06106 [Thecamonas trahens ATCC 50062]
MLQGSLGMASGGSARLMGCPPPPTPASTPRSLRGGVGTSPSEMYAAYAAGNARSEAEGDGDGSGDYSSDTESFGASGPLECVGVLEMDQEEASPMVSATVIRSGRRPGMPTASLVDVFPPTEPLFRGYVGKRGTCGEPEIQVLGDGFAARARTRKRRSDSDGNDDDYGPQTSPNAPYSVPPSISSSPSGLFIAGQGQSSRRSSHSTSPSPMPGAYGSPVVAMHAFAAIPARASKKKRGLN